MQHGRTLMSEPIRQGGNTMEATWLKEMGLSGESIFVIIVLMFMLQIAKLVADYVKTIKKEGGASHDDIMKLCLAILEKLDHR